MPRLRTFPAVLRLALRSLRERPAPALVSGVGLMVGVAGLHAMVLGTDGALASLTEVYEQSGGPAAFALVSAGDATAPLPLDALAVAEADPDVAFALPLTQTSTVRLEEVDAWMGVILPQGDASLLVLGLDPRECVTLPCRMRLVAGDRSGALVGEAWAESRDLGVGDKLHLVSAGRVVEWTISGLLAREGLATRGFGRVVVAPIEQVHADFSLAPGQVDELGLVLRDGADETAVEARLEAALGPGVAVVRPAERGLDVGQRLGNLRAATDLLRGVALFLALFLIYGQYAARAAERARTTGLLRTLGATRAQAAGVLVVEAALVGLPAALLGAALGFPLARAIALAMAQAAAADLRVDRPDVPGALGAAAIGLATALATVAIPAWIAATRPALESLRAWARVALPPPPWTAAAGLGLASLCFASLMIQPAETSDRAFTLLRCLGLLAGVAAALPVLLPRGAARISGAVAARLGPAAGLGLAGLRWRPARSGLAAGAVMAGVALVGGVASLGTSLLGEMSSWIDRSLVWDLYVSHPRGFSDEDAVAATSLPGVKRLATASFRPVTVQAEDRTVHLTAVAIDPGVWGPADVMDFAADTARAPAALWAELGEGRTAFVTEIVRAQLGIEPGETVRIAGATGPVELRISAVVRDYSGNGYALLVDRDTARAALGLARTDVLAIQVEAGQETAVAEALSARAGVRIEQKRELHGRILVMVDQAMGALDVLQVMAAIVALIAVGAAIAQAAFERRGDVAALRALGLTRRQGAAMLYAEAVATALPGAILGVMAGLLLGLVFAAATRTLGIPVPFVPPWRTLLGAALAAVFASLAATALPARRLRGVSAVEALRRE